MAKIKVLEKKVLSSGNVSRVAWFFGNKEYSFDTVASKISTYCKGKLAGVIQYQLYVPVELENVVKLNAGSVEGYKTVKFFEGTVENEVFPAEKESDGALDDGSNDEPEEDFLATLDTSIEEDSEIEDELVDEAEKTEYLVTFYENLAYDNEDNGNISVEYRPVFVRRRHI